jgi:hypothetical protein
VSAGRLWELRSVIVARVRDRNPMEVADDLGHRFGDYFRKAIRELARVAGRIARSKWVTSTDCALYVQMRRRAKCPLILRNH